MNNRYLEKQSITLIQKYESNTYKVIILNVITQTTTEEDQPLNLCVFPGALTSHEQLRNCVIYLLFVWNTYKTSFRVISLNICRKYFLQWFTTRFYKQYYRFTTFYNVKFMMHCILFHVVSACVWLIFWMEVINIVLEQHIRKCASRFFIPMPCNSLNNALLTASNIKYRGPHHGNLIRQWKTSLITFHTNIIRQIKPFWLTVWMMLNFSFWSL